MENNKIIIQGKTIMNYNPEFEHLQNLLYWTNMSFNWAERKYPDILLGHSTYYNRIEEAGVEYKNVRVYENGNGVGRSGDDLYFYDANTQDITLVGNAHNFFLQEVA